MDVAHIYKCTMRNQSAGSISEPPAAVITVCYLRLYALMFYYCALLSANLSLLFSFSLLILPHTSSFTWGLSPPLAHLIGRWAQSSVYHNEIPGGERNSVKSRGGQQKGGEEFRVDVASLTCSDRKPVEYSIFLPCRPLLSVSLTPSSPLFISHLPFTAH